MRSARIGPCPWCATVANTGGRAGRQVHRTPSGHHLHSGADVHPPPEREKQSRPGTTSRRRANARTNRNRSCRAQRGRNTTELRIVEEHSSQRPIPGRTPSTPWWRHASRDRTHRSARDWQRYVVGKVLLSPRTAKGPGAGAGGVATIKVAGTRVGRLLPSPMWSAGATQSSARYECRCRSGRTPTLRRHDPKWKT